ncbi:MAG: hypothetical protein JXB05_14955 [Myxococcaceae bacterium]|nr:hypothetical protein [Myxococcaceae bacterium]
MTVQDKKDDVEVTQEPYELSREELRGTYSKLFTHPDDLSGRGERRKICELLKSPAPAKPEIEKLLAGYNGRPQGEQCTLSDKQLECLREAFTSDKYKDLRMIDTGENRERQTPVEGKLTVGPWELTLIYHALLGRRRDPTDTTTHDLLHEMKRAAIDPRIPEGEKLKTIKACLQKAYTQQLSAAESSQIEVPDQIVKEIIAMLDDSRFKTIEPYEGEPCLVGNKSIACY